MTIPGLILLQLFAFSKFYQFLGSKVMKSALFPVFPSQPMYPIYQQILSVMLSKYIQNLTICHLHCFALIQSTTVFCLYIITIATTASATLQCAWSFIHWAKPVRAVHDPLNPWPDCITLKFKILQWLLNESHCESDKQRESQILPLAARLYVPASCSHHLLLIH